MTARAWEERDFFGTPAETFIADLKSRARAAEERAEKAERERDEARARIAQLEREMAGEQEGRSKLLRAYEARDGEVAALLAVCSQEQIDQAIRRVQSPHPTR